MKFLAKILVILSIAFSGQAFATQATIPQPVTGPHTMADLNTNYLNPALQTLLTNNKGNSAPTSPVGGQFWVNDTSTTWLLNQYDGASWVQIGTINATTHVFTLTSAISGGTINNSIIGGTTPAAITGTTITANTQFSGPHNGTVGATTPSTVAATTISASGPITSTQATGTAPFTVASTTKVTNLYVDRAALADTVTTNANLTGDVTSVGNATTLTNAPVIAKVLTGYVSGAGTVASTDSILQAIQKLNGNNATNANLTGPITSVGNATSIASQTGTGTKFVVDTSPTLVTPIIGVATATTVNKVTVTAPATGSTLTIADGKTLTANNTLAFSGTDSTTMTYPATSSTVLTTGNTATVTKGFTITPNSLGNMTSFTLDPTAGNYQYGTNHATLTITAPASDCAIDLLITNDATAGAITFSGFTVGASTGDLLTTTNTNKFILSVLRINAISTYTIKALQ